MMCITIDARRWMQLDAGASKGCSPRWSMGTIINGACLLVILTSSQEKFRYGLRFLAAREMTGGVGRWF